MLYRICVLLALVDSCSMFGADQRVKVPYYKITNTHIAHTLLVPKTYFDTVCSTEIERKWVFGLQKHMLNKPEIVGLDFTLLANQDYTPKKNKHTFHVECLAWHPQAWEPDKIQQGTGKHTLLKYIEEHGDEKFRKMFQSNASV